jgi:hypothetical protein
LAIYFWPFGLFPKSSTSLLTFLAKKVSIWYRKLEDLIRSSSSLLKMTKNGHFGPKMAILDHFCHFLTCGDISVPFLG